MKRIFVLMSVLLLFGFVLSAQPPKLTPNLRPAIPSTPQAVAFTRLGEYAINNSSGVPDIGIHLFDIDHHGYKIPFDLRYEARPLKPGYNYDVSGLGWAISGNSCVSRTIKDRADEYGYFNNPFELDQLYNSKWEPRRYKDYADMLDVLNYQFDEYKILLPSGRVIPFFMYKEDGKLKFDLLDSDKNILIKCSYSSHSITAFEVTDESGVEYIFDVADKASNSFDNETNADRNVSWMLSRIHIPFKGTVSYEYNAPKVFYTDTFTEPILKITRLYSQSLSYEPSLSLNITKKELCSRYSMRLLKRIMYGPTTVDFNYQPDGLHLMDITLSDEGRKVKKFNFHIHNSTLDSLIFSGTNNTEKLVYKFNYTANNPGENTDHWGNRTYSGKAEDIGNFNIFIDKGFSQSDLNLALNSIGNRVKQIPNKPTDLQCYYKLKLQSSTSYNSRSASPPEMNCVLSSITYPNGGCTLFTFENHSFLTATGQDGDLIYDRRKQQVMNGGGFRIKSIKNYTVDGKLASQDEYRYGFTCKEAKQKHFPVPVDEFFGICTHTGLGEAVVDPNMLTYLSYNCSPYRLPHGFLQMLHGIHMNSSSSFENYTSGDGGAWWWEATFSAFTYRNLLGSRNAVVYPEITVYHGDPESSGKIIGKTVYKYDIYAYNTRHYLSDPNQMMYPDTTYVESIYCMDGGNNFYLYCMENPSQRDMLKSKTDYVLYTDKSSNTSEWLACNMEEYSYTEEGINKTGKKYTSTISPGHCSIHTMSYGTNRNINSIYLYEFYSTVEQRVGRHILRDKTQYVFRENSRTPMRVSESYSYAFGNNLKERTFSDSFSKKDSYTFVGECSDSDSIFTAMKALNILSPIVSATRYATNYMQRPVAGYKLDYSYFNSAGYLPSRVYELNGNDFEESLEVLSYTRFGNPREVVDLRTGLHTVYVWGHSDRYLIAEVTGATLSQVQIALNTLNDITSQINDIRSLLPDALIQTWSYIPLIGVSSYTDITGKTTKYEYDGLGRLKSDAYIVGGSLEKLHSYHYNFKN